MLDREIITEEEAMNHPEKNIINKCIGYSDECELNIYSSNIGLIPDDIIVPETVPISPGSPVETPLDRWVLISYIQPESLEPYLKDIYMEDLYKAMDPEWKQKI